LYIHEDTVEYPVLQFANHCTFMKSLLNILCHNFAKYEYFKLKQSPIDYLRLLRENYFKLKEILTEYPALQFANYLTFTDFHTEYPVLQMA